MTRKKAGMKPKLPSRNWIRKQDNGDFWGFIYLKLETEAFGAIQPEIHWIVIAR